LFFFIIIIVCIGSFSRKSSLLPLHINSVISLGAGTFGAVRRLSDTAIMLDTAVYRASSRIITHYYASLCIIKYHHTSTMHHHASSHHQASPSITTHSIAHRIITHHHASSSIITHHQASSSHRTAARITSR